MTAATTARLRHGQRQVQDGPFPDTKEQLGGFFLIDVPDLDAALAEAFLAALADWPRRRLRAGHRAGDGSGRGPIPAGAGVGNGSRRTAPPLPRHTRPVTINTGKGGDLWILQKQGGMEQGHPN